VRFDGKKYTFRATRLYSKSPFLRIRLSSNTNGWMAEKGEEIYMSYGPHPNDFLFVECA
jgi:hypothetical protein